MRGDMSSSIQCIFWTSSARKSTWRVLQGAHAGGTAVWAHEQWFHQLVSQWITGSLRKQNEVEQCVIIQQRSELL